ncbi:MAG: hypothetical protein RLZZ352_342 [Pseudomonadota bacterium]|jgi:ferredoxin
MNPARKALPWVDAARCTGCGWCVAACAPHVLSLDVRQGKKFAHLHDAPGCTGCALCAVKCPFQVITMLRWAESDARRGAPVQTESPLHVPHGHH